MNKEEAINIIKKNWPDNSYSSLKEALEILIPELREDNDETVRKNIIDFLSRQGASIKYNFEGWITWLEKQRKQKPIMIQWNGDNLKDLIDFTGVSPKFGEWFKNWTEYENYVHSHNNIFKMFNEDGSHYEVPVGAWIVKTPDGFNVASKCKFVPKPAEWSENDKICFDNVYDIIVNGLEVCELGERTRREMRKWLESLKPQYHWKPSEEQTNALYHIVREFGKDKSKDEMALESLLYDLKKL